MTTFREQLYAAMKEEYDKRQRGEIDPVAEAERMRLLEADMDDLSTEELEAAGGIHDKLVQSFKETNDGEETCGETQRRQPTRTGGDSPR